MPKTINLPDGDSAVIRLAGEVPERLRRAVLIAQAQMLEASGIKISDDDKPDVSGFDMGSLRYQGPVNDATILAHLKSWSYLGSDGNPLPINSDTVQDLPAAIYDTLLKEANENSKNAVLDTSPAGAMDPMSPTAPLAE